MKLIILRRRVKSSPKLIFASSKTMETVIFWQLPLIVTSHDKSATNIDNPHASKQTNKLGLDNAFCSFFP